MQMRYVSIMVGLVIVGNADGPWLDSSAGSNGLKKQGSVVLQPQPSDDPNDPLNWSRAWKYSHFFVIMIGSSLTNAYVCLGPVMETPY